MLILMGTHQLSDIYVPSALARRAAESRRAGAIAIFEGTLDDVWDFANRITSSDHGARSVTRAAYTRFASGELVRAKGDVAGQLVATVYHEAAEREHRATQPVATGTHMLTDAQVSAVNSHVAHCRRCRRWGAIGQSGSAVAPPPAPVDVQQTAWRDIESFFAIPAVQPLIEDTAPAPEPPPAAPAHARHLTALWGNQHERRRWLIAGLFGVALLALAGVFALTSLLMPGGDDARDPADIGIASASDGGDGEDADNSASDGADGGSERSQQSSSAAADGGGDDDSTDGDDDARSSPTTPAGATGGPADDDGDATSGDSAADDSSDDGDGSTTGGGGAGDGTGAGDAPTAGDDVTDSGGATTNPEPPVTQPTPPADGGAVPEPTAPPPPLPTPTPEPPPPPTPVPPTEIVPAPATPVPPPPPTPTPDPGLIEPILDPLDPVLDPILGGVP